MSLQYIIDGYNIINHPIFIQQINKKIKDKKVALLELIRTQRLTGSKNNKITVVFDGYPSLGGARYLSDNNEMFNIIFSREETADERIMNIVQNCPNPKNIVVVSDDKQIRFFVNSCGAKAINVEEFAGSKEKLKQKKKQQDSLKLEITYSQMHEINQELRKIWLE